MLIALFIAVGLSSAGFSYVYTTQYIIAPSVAGSSGGTTSTDAASPWNTVASVASLSVPSLAPPEVAILPTATPSANVAEEPTNRAVPILIYHSIGDNDSEMQELFVSVEDFTTQIDYLQRAGYTCISFDLLWDCWQNNKPLPEKPVILTFDDGYRSFYNRVFPLLLERGITATLFLVSEHFDLPRGMTRGMARDVAAEGFEIGSHSRYHRNLGEVSLYEAKQEVLYSKEDLEKMLDKPVRIFAYPEGQHNAELRVVIHDAGYRFAVTATEGLAHAGDDYYQLNRILVGRSDGLQGFIYKLEKSR